MGMSMYDNPHIDFRLKNEGIVAEIRRKVQAQPTAVCHIPQALKYLVTTETLLNDAHEVRIS